MDNSIFKLAWNVFWILFMAGISTLTVQQYFQTFFEKKKSIVKVWIVLGAYFIWQIISMLGMPTFSEWLRLVISIVAAIVMGYIVEGKWLPKIIFSIIYIAVALLIELLGASFLLMLGIDYTTMSLVGSLITKLFLLLLIKMLQGFFFHDAVQKLSWYYNAALMFLPIGSIFISMHLFALSSQINEVKYVRISFIFFIAILGVNVAMFRIYIKLSEHLELKRKNSVYELEIQLYNEHIKEKESTMLEFRRAKHDMKHQVIYLLELLESKEYEKLDENLKKLIDWELLEGVTIANSDNLMIDALINYKYNIAKRYGISFGINLEVPTSLPFEDAELCVILGNALDNAIEACQRGNIPNPYVELNIKYDRGNLIVIVENPYDGMIKKTDNGKIITRKEKTKQHGIGISSIERAVDKYYGYFNVESDENIFRVKIILYSDLKG